MSEQATNTLSEKELEQKKQKVVDLYDEEKVLLRKLGEIKQVIYQTKEQIESTSEGKKKIQELNYVSTALLKRRPFDYLPLIEGMENVDPENIEIHNLDRKFEAHFLRETDAVLVLKGQEHIANHVEVQSNFDKTINERIRAYMFLILETLPNITEVHTLLINLNKDDRCEELGEYSWGGLKIKYQVVNMWEEEYSKYRDSENVSMLVFAAYMKGVGEKELDEAQKIIESNVLDERLKSEMLFMFALATRREFPDYNKQLIQHLMETQYDSFVDDPAFGPLVEGLKEKLSPKIREEMHKEDQPKIHQTITDFAEEKGLPLDLLKELEQKLADTLTGDKNK